MALGTPTTSSNRKTRRCPRSSFTQYGATAGGPIKKDKIFWFAGFESQELSLGITTPIAAPVDMLLPGGNTKTNVGLSMVNACMALNPSNLPFGTAGNKVSPLSAQLAGLTSSCNVQQATASIENVFVYNPGPTNEVVPGGLAALTDSNSSYNGIAKVDYHVNDRNNFTGMFFIGQTVGTWDDNPSAEVSQWWTTYTPIHVREGSGGWTYVPNSNIVNELNVGYTYSYRPYFSTDASVNPAAPWGLTSAGLPTGYGINTGVTNPEYFGFPRISIQGFTLMGGNWPKIIGPDANTEFVEHLSYLKGKHAFKFGGEVTFVEGDGGATTNAKGRFNFKKTSGASGISSIESFLEGNVATGSGLFVGNPVRDMHNEMYALFFQDDYRVTPRLTVNYGLRWELATVIQEADNQLGNFDPNSSTGFVQVGDGLSSPYNADHKDFSPRLGFAWDITGKQTTVLRGGASLMYEFVPYSAFLQLGGNSVGIGKVPTGADLCVQGSCIAGSGTIAAATVTPPVAGPNGLSALWNAEGPNNPIFSAAVACGDGHVVTSGPQVLIGSAPGPCSTGAIQRNLQTPYVETWNLDIQHSFTNNLSLDVAYIGNHGAKLYGTQDLNAPPLGAGWGNPNVSGTPANVCIMTAGANCTVNTAAEVGPYTAKFPYISYIDYLSNLYRSHYNAAQITLTQRTSHGLSFTATYAYSHALDDVSQNFGSTVPLNNAAPDASMYGNSDYDIRNRFTLEATYLIPGKHVKGQLLEGWQLTSIVTLQSATPWNVQDLTQDISGTGEINNPNPWGEDWNFFGKAKDFTAVPGTAGIPYSGTAPNGAAILAQCQAADMAHFSGATQQLALASLSNLGCYASGNSVLLPPAYGTYGNLGRGTFRDTPFKTWDFSVQKNTKIGERLTAQFRAEFFNVLNHPLFGDVGSRHLAQNDPSVGGSPFAAATETPDQAAGNPVLGSGSNRDIQLGLKLIF